MSKADKWSNTTQNETFFSNNVRFMENPEEMLKPWLSNPMFFEIAIIHAVTFMFGLIGNAVVITVMAGDRRAKSATNTFLVSLAVGDLLMLCVYGPLETYHHFVIQWDEEAIICKTAKFAELLSAMSSVLNLLAVTVERFIVIVFPMKSRTLCTTANTTRAVFVVWVTAFGLSLPTIFTTGTFKYTFTNNVTTLTLTYCDGTLNNIYFVVYQFIVIFIIPSSLMIICYSFVIRELWTSTRQMKIMTQGGSLRTKKCGKRSDRYQMTSSNSEYNFPNSESYHQQMYASTKTTNDGGHSIKRLFSKKGQTKVVTTSCKSVKKDKDEANYTRKQVIKMLILVVILFFVCWGPRLTMDVLQKFGLVPFHQYMYRIRISFNILTFMHGCINPFIYCFMSKNFRSRFLKFLEICGCYHPSYTRNSDILLLPVPSQKSSSVHIKTTDNTAKQPAVSLTGMETKVTELSC